MPNVLHNIGNTPLVKLNRIGKAEGLQCEIRECATDRYINGMSSLFEVLDLLSPSFDSGEMRVFQRGRERQGPHRAAHGGGRREEGPPEAGRHHHRTDFRQHR